MSFYDNVKDDVRKDARTDAETEQTDGSDDGPATEDGNVAFDELISNAQEADEDEEEEQQQQQDDTEIENFSDGAGGSSEDYGDPSSIEINEDAPAQAVREDDDGQQEQQDDRSQQQDRGDGSDRSQSGQTTAGPDDSGGQRQETAASSHQTTDAPDADEEVEIHSDGSVGAPGDEPDEEPAFDRDDDLEAVLADIREQNRTMIELLRSIERNLR